VTHLTRRRSLLVALSLVAVAVSVLASCGSSDSAGPPEINYGRDVCSGCHMIISEARFAAAFRDGSGKAHVFDDIGEMVASAVRSGDSDGVTAWVHDYHSERWVDAPDATYVKGGEIVSPMGSNLVAFGDRSAAEAFATEQGGKVLTWTGLASDASAPRSGDGRSDQEPNHQTHER